MKWLNLTPHEITLRRQGEEWDDLVIPPSGTVARVATTAEPAGEVGGVTVVRMGYGAVEGLPALDRDQAVMTPKLVSALVLQRPECAGRRDVFAPDTSLEGVIRDGAGRIVAVRRLVAAPEVSR